MFFVCYFSVNIYINKQWTVDLFLPYVYGTDIVSGLNVCAIFENWSFCFDIECKQFSVGCGKIRIEIQPGSFVCVFFFCFSLISCFCCLIFFLFGQSLINDLISTHVQHRINVLHLSHFSSLKDSVLILFAFTVFRNFIMLNRTSCFV